jgi:subtilase family serine protease
MASGVGVTLVVCALVAQILTQSVSLEGKEECKPFIKFATPEDIKSQNTRLGRRISQSTVSGFHPQDVKQFYGFSTSSSAGSGKTIAVIAAYDNPNVESDLGVFSTEFGLPSYVLS